MKNYCGILALAMVMVFSFMACGEDSATGGGGGGGGEGLDGSWYSSTYMETFTFDKAAKEFSKTQSDGSGERGTFTYNATHFTTTIKEIKIWQGDELSNWIPFDPSSKQNGGVEERPYMFSGGNLILWGSNVYTKLP